MGFAPFQAGNILLWHSSNETTTPIQVQATALPKLKVHSKYILYFREIQIHTWLNWIGSCGGLRLSFVFGQPTI